MSESAEKREVYYIPDNYISESRFHIGQMTVRVRYLIDSLILTAILGVFALLFVLLVMADSGTSAKLTVAVIICGPGFVAGQIGYNGDPVSTTLKHLLAWSRSSDVRLYNTNPRLLGTDPVKALQEETDGRNTMAEVYSNFRDSLRRTAEEGELVEGENFEFRYDPGIDGYLNNNGDYEDGGNSESFELESSTDSDIDSIRFVFSADGYNEQDEEEINLSDYETD